jgi:hypothetical protein
MHMGPGGARRRLTTAAPNVAPPTVIDVTAVDDAIEAAVTPPTAAAPADIRVGQVDAA